MQNQSNYSARTLRRVRSQLKLALYAMDNEKPAATLSIAAHRATARRLTEELLADVDLELIAIARKPAS